MTATIGTITSYKKMTAAIQNCGFLPLFANAVPGFSIEEHTPSRYWFSDTVDGPWEWKGPAIRESDCVYGKFFGGKTGFISREWFPDFANYRRDGYDYDARYEEGLAPYGDKIVYDTLAARGSLLSKDLKVFSGYAHGNRQKFETIVARLQAECYIVIEDFQYEIGRSGTPYGWGVARYTTPEKRYGRAFTSRVYRYSPEQSKMRIIKYLSKQLPYAEPAQILKFLR